MRRIYFDTLIVVYSVRSCCCLWRRNVARPVDQKDLLDPLSQTKLCPDCFLAGLKVDCVNWFRILLMPVVGPLRRARPDGRRHDAEANSQGSSNCTFWVATNFNTASLIQRKLKSEMNNYTDSVSRIESDTTLHWGS